MGEKREQDGQQPDSQGELATRWTVYMRCSEALQIARQIELARLTGIKWHRGHYVEGLVFSRFSTEFNFDRSGYCRRG